MWLLSADSRLRRRSAVFNAAFLMFVCAWVPFFTALEPVAGLSWGALLAVPMWLSATWFQAHVAKAWAWSLIPNLTGWVMQARGLCWVQV